MNSSTISSSQSDSVTENVPEPSMRGPIVRPVLAILKPNPLFYIPIKTVVCFEYPKSTAECANVIAAPA